MSIIPPAPSSSRGNIVVQPAYFTSNLYVNAIRDDLMTLSHKYIQRYNADSSKPFQLFKDLWKGDGWTWLQFKVFDPRAREAFLDATLRVFMGETPFDALFMGLTHPRRGYNANPITNETGCIVIWNVYILLHAAHLDCASNPCGVTHPHTDRCANTPITRAIDICF